MNQLFTKLRAVFLASSILLAMPMALWAACPDRPACKGCGCKGEAGYRAPDGRCVGFKDLVKTCGAFPHAACTFENALGTGANKECALAPKQPTQKSAPKMARQIPEEPEILEEEEEENEEN